jgi:hypothetical protein
MFLTLNIERAYCCTFERTNRGEARRRDVLCLCEADQRIRDFISGLDDDREDLLAIALV